jgi:hypothetical protein
MARVIGGTKSWLWWLGGLLCAVVFGAEARPAQKIALYGVRPRPRVPPVKVDPKSVTEEQKKAAAKLVDEYMGSKAAGTATEKDKQEIAKLIKDFGSDQFAVRESASKAILKFGGKALEQLKEALKSKDAEVVQRAEAAIAALQGGGSNRLVAELRGNYSAAILVISERRGEWKKKAYAAELQAIALEAQGKKAEAEKKRATKRAADKKMQELDKLRTLVVSGARYRKIIRRKMMDQPAYGVRRRG